MTNETAAPVAAAEDVKLDAENAEKVTEQTPPPVEEKVDPQAELEKLHKSYQKRIGRLTRKVGELQGALGSVQKPQAQEADDSDDLDAVIERRLQEREQKREAEKYYEKSRSILEKAAEVGDFDLEDFIPLPRGAADAIVELEKPEIFAYLQKNPDEIERLSKLSIARQAAEIGKLELKLSEKPAPKKSGAPAPITPIQGSAKPSGYRPDMTQAEYEEWRNSTRKANR